MNNKRYNQAWGLHGANGLHGLRCAHYYFLFIIYYLLFTTLGSCSSDDAAPEEPGTPITLLAYTAQPLATRADSSLLANEVIPAEKSIGVYAYYHDNTTWAAADAAEPKQTAPNFMRNQKATNSGINSPFTYSPIKYWPNEETDKLSFIAYYPYCTGVVDGSPEDINHTGIIPLLNGLGIGYPNGTGLPTFRFTVKDDVKKQVDFMVSDLIPDLPHSRDTEGDLHTPFNDLTISDRVRFRFVHATSKIEFRIRASEEVRQNMAYFTLKGITLTNIYNEALLTPTYSAGDGTTLTWSGYQDYHWSDYACKTTEAYLLLPQTLRADAHLSVTYDLAFKSGGTTYTYDGSGNLVPTEEYAYINRTTDMVLKDLTLTGSGDPLTAWLPNHHYIYNLVINPHGIGFEAKVVDWGEYVEINDIVVEEQ